MTTPIANAMRSLQVGDVLYMPMPHLGTTLKSVILHVDEKGFYPSWPQEDHFVSCPLIYSPYRWSDMEGAVVDYEGEIPKWYSEQVIIEKGANLDTPAEYARIPRRKDLKIDISNDELKGFYSQRNKKLMDKILMIQLILRNQIHGREAGSDANAAELLLEAAGVKEYDRDALCLLALLVNELREAQKEDPHMMVVVPVQNMEHDASIPPPRKPMATKKRNLH